MADPLTYANNRVLLIEDHELLAKLTAKMIRTMGYEVAHVGSIADARAISPFDFGIVLTDYSLPDGEAAELLTYIRQRANIPVLLLTAFAVDDVPEPVRSSFDHVLTKPVDKDFLHQILEKYLPVT